ncbi:HNH endonuclease [Propionispora vibrioides]|uniref:TIGR02646 family protein n=1 Tax=Propionispora vibrioides TaxID=112903 RepID=A0A1H8WVN9_9FIRM|nr:HNH endonuclease signature motif containing protein [Propionispora vibrioides]SEP31706.1 TIGR02646 family protein [Propionispora vibrioides]
MRIHGEVKITRRDGIATQANYQKYQNYLSEDFHHRCGYCGKKEIVTTKGFEIDHFVPETLAPERETDYYNLVYSCFTCNRKKSKKWPTNDKNIMNDGKVGFIDPATEEFDLHLHRRPDGSIEGLTDIGKYMCSKAFKFDMRPIRELWLCSEILSRQELLECKIATMSPEESVEYININKQLKELYQLLFSKKE